MTLAETHPLQLTPHVADAGIRADIDKFRDMLAGYRAGT
ncbi:MAG: hypothetical protein ACI9BK_002862, partial [Acidimicrobiales bacterium]